MSVTKRKLIQIVAIAKMDVTNTNVKYIPDKERMNAITRRAIKIVICKESFKTSFLKENTSIFLFIFCDVKNPKIMPILIISTKRRMMGVRRNRYRILILNATLRITNESIVNSPIESNEKVESFMNSFFLPLKTHVAKEIKRKTNMNIPAKDSS